MSMTVGENNNNDNNITNNNVSLFARSTTSALGSKAETTTTTTSPCKLPGQQRQFESESYAGGTLDQVVSKYVDCNGPKDSGGGGVLESKECLLSTQVPYSEESSTSTSASRFATDSGDSSSPPTCSAPAAKQQQAASQNHGLFSLSSDVLSTYETIRNVATVDTPNVDVRSRSPSPDTLESILPSCLLQQHHNYHHHGSSPPRSEWLWDMPLLPHTNNLIPSDQHCDSYRSNNNTTNNNQSSWLPDLSEPLTPFLAPIQPNSSYPVVVLNDVDQQELNYLQERSYEAGSPGRNQWQMNLQGVGENNYNSQDSFPMADWDQRLHPDSTSVAYADFSDTVMNSTSDLYMVENLNSNSMLPYNNNNINAYDDGFLFPHLMEDSMLYV